MTNNELLQSYIPLVEFLGNVLGKHAEVLLHDVSDPEQSVIAICNGFHSGRKVGHAMTDLALQIQSEKQYEGQDYIINYKAASQDKVFRSSTYYIKNHGELIGMLCINIDTSASQDLLQTVKQFVENANRMPIEAASDQGIVEKLDLPIVSFADSVIGKIIADSAIPPKRMTTEEKKEIVRKLHEQGIPRMKGAVAEIARQLHLAESTVYRYISHL